MSDPKSPPRSFASEGDEEALDDKPPRARLPERAVSFDDEFSPSVARFHAAEGIPAGLGEHLFYNDQLHETLEMALERCCALGLPRLVTFFPTNFCRFGEGDFQRLERAYEGLAKKPKHGTFEWLCLQVYVRFAVANATATDGGSAESIADAMFFCGAALRELELSERNRLDSLRGKKTRRAASAGGKLRSADARSIREDVVRQMQTLIDQGKSQTNAATILAKRKLHGKTATAILGLWKRYKPR